MNHSEVRATVLMVSFGLIVAASWHYGGPWLVVGVTGVFWAVCVIRK